MEKKMKTPAGDVHMYTGVGPSRREITDVERNAMRRGELACIPPDVIRKLIGGGVGFEIDAPG